MAGVEDEITGDGLTSIPPDKSEMSSVFKSKDKSQGKTSHLT